MHSKFHNSSLEDSTSSLSEEDELPCLTLLRSSRDVQKKIDKRIAQLERMVDLEVKRGKIKCKRGGSVDVLVLKNVRLGHLNAFWVGDKTETEL